MKQHTIPRIITKLIVPFILLFGLYVQFHGEISAGGGFQAGVIFASGFILYNVIFGINVGEKILPTGLTISIMAFGIFLYIFVGLLGILLGGNYLDYNLLGESKVQGQIIGIFLVELGVGITVSSVMILIYYSFNKFEDNK